MSQLRQKADTNKALKTFLLEDFVFCFSVVVIVLGASPTIVTRFHKQ